MTGPVSDDAIRSLGARVLHIIQQRTGLHTHLAAPIRDDIIAELRRNYGSERIYVSVRDPDRRDALKKAIAENFDGTTKSRETLCRQHHISRRTFYRLVNDDIPKA